MKKPGPPDPGRALTPQTQAAELSRGRSSVRQRGEPSSLHTALSQAGLPHAVQGSEAEACPRGPSPPPVLPGQPSVGSEPPPSPPPTFSQVLKSTAPRRPGVSGPSPGSPSPWSPPNTRDPDSHDPASSGQVPMAPGLRPSRHAMTRPREEQSRSPAGHQAARRGIDVLPETRCFKYLLFVLTIPVNYILYKIASFYPIY